jgi:hypothetical protein
MLKCWNVLVPVKLMEAYEGAIAKLDQLVMQPESWMVE